MSLKSSFALLRKLLVQLDMVTRIFPGFIFSQCLKVLSLCEYEIVLMI